MAAIKEKLGRIPCEGCGHPMVLKRNEAMTLTCACDECDVSSFAKKGTDGAKRWLSKLPKVETPSENVPKAAVPAVPKQPAPAPVPKKPANAFEQFMSGAK